MIKPFSSAGVVLGCAAFGALWPVAAQPAVAQSAGADSLRTHLPDASRVDGTHLVPHRLRLDLGGSLADVFDTPEVYVALERTHHYRAGDARPAVRVRWVANTHAHEDGVVLDAEHMNVLQVETLGGSGIRDAARTMAFVRGDSITSVTWGPTGSVSTRTAAWPDESAAHLMMLPYWFASFDARPGERFVLPGFSSRSGARQPMVIRVLEPDPDDPDVGRFVSEHGWVRIEWFVDRERAPYLRRMNWHYLTGARAGQVSRQRVADAFVFDGDQYTGTVRGR